MMLTLYKAKLITTAVALLVVILLLQRLGL
jgi:hypothetical protein